MDIKFAKILKCKRKLFCDDIEEETKMAKIINIDNISKSKKQYNILKTNEISTDDKTDEVLPKIVIENRLNWLINNHDGSPLRINTLREWLMCERYDANDQMMFCDKDIAHKILHFKCIFDNIDKNKLCDARAMSNPFELVGQAFFNNRGAVKMANIDQATNFVFTRLNNESNELIYFADVCAGPGGFSEYMLWRKKWNIKGFGMTLREKDDFQLNRFYNNFSETLHPYYGPLNDGNIYNTQNQKGFNEIIMKDTEGKGVHFMMGDGEFSVDGQGNMQEILLKRIYLCQCLIALMVIRTGGHCVIKFFEIYTPFSAGLVYLMYRCFDRICIFKPHSSRPANSERYLVCLGKLANVSDVITYLSEINEKISTNDRDNNVTQIVSLNELEYETCFKKFLIDSNNDIGNNQITALSKILAFCNDINLVEPSQSIISKKCLELWRLSDNVKKIPKFFYPTKILHFLITKENHQFMSHMSLKKSDFIDKRINKDDWFCATCVSTNIENTNSASFYFGLGNTNVFRFTEKMWKRVSVSFKLPPHTLVYAEIIDETQINDSMQRTRKVVHIIDAYVLGGINISQLDLLER
uniref:Methyltransferase 1 n=1 Tax=Nesodiprion zhejiangensis nucleopolyhedrovirus TaxID=3135970 RepID=A0AAN0LPR9_9BACU